MAGFGQAFSRSYENARDRRHQSEEREKQNIANEKQDAFRMYYSTFQENQKYLREQERADAKRVRDSEVVAQLTGYDPRAVHSLLEADYTPQQIQDMYENGAEIESIVDATQGKQEPAANEQTKEMLKGSPQATPQGAPADPLANNPYRDEFNQKIAAGTGTRLDQVEQAVSFNPADSTSKKARNLDIKWKLPKKTSKADAGPTTVPEIIRAITVAERDGDTDTASLLKTQLSNLQGATAKEDPQRMIDTENELISVINDPNVPAADKARYVTQLEQVREADRIKREQDIKTSETLKGNLPPEGAGMAIINTPEGKRRVHISDVPEGAEARPESPAEVKAQNEIFEFTKEEAKNINKRAVKYKQAEHIINNINEIIKTDPEVATAGGAISATADSLVKNAAGILDSVDQIINEVQNGGDYTGGAEALSEAEANIKGLLQQGGPTNKRALNYALLEINRRRLAYIQAASVGSQGTSLSQKEYEGFYDGLSKNGGQALVLGNILRDIRHDFILLGRSHGIINTTSHTDDITYKFSLVSI